MGSYRCISLDTLLFSIKLEVVSLDGCRRVLECIRMLIL